MKKIIAILIICFIALGLMFGCTETDTPDNTNNNSGDTVNNQPSNTTNNNGASTGGTTDSEIPMPPALPE